MARGVSLNEVAILVRLHVKVYSGQKTDAEAGQLLADQWNADEDVAKVIKKVVDSDVLTKIKNFAAGVRLDFRQRVLPWDSVTRRGTIVDDNAVTKLTAKAKTGRGMWYILPISEWDKLSTFLAESEKTFNKMVFDEFLPYWQEVIDAQESRLNGGFRRADYPTNEQMIGKFLFEYSVAPVPSFGDFRVTLRESVAEKFKAEIDARHHNAKVAMVQDLCTRLLGPIEHMVTMLSDHGRILHKSLINNVADMMQTVKSLDITGDSEVARVLELTKQLVKFDSGMLTDAPEIRDVVAFAAQKTVAEIKKVSAVDAINKRLEGVI